MRWENLHKSTAERVARQMVTALFMVMMLIGSVIVLSIAQVLPGLFVKNASSES